MNSVDSSRNGTIPKVTKLIILKVSYDKTDPSIKIISSSTTSLSHSPWPSFPVPPQKRETYQVLNLGYTLLHLQTHDHLSLLLTLLFQVCQSKPFFSKLFIPFPSASTLEGKTKKKNKRDRFLIMSAPQATMVSGTWNTISEHLWNELLNALQQIHFLNSKQNL